VQLDARADQSDARVFDERLLSELPRASRSRAMTIAFEKANEGPTTSTVASSTTAPPTAASVAPAPKVATVAKAVPAAAAKPKPPTTTTAKPKATTTTAKPKPVTTTAKPTTTTTAKPTTTSTAKPTTTTAAPSAGNRQEGGASYHDYPDPKTCAHRTLPMGTILTVTNLDNGKQTTCRVNDRGPFVAGRILDLSRVAFGEIASVSQGVIRVSIEW
jgi:rare lipoprotein A